MGETTSPRDPIVFDALWSGVINDWDNDDRHHRFLEHARLEGSLLDAAARYRPLKDDPERALVAQKRLEAIAFLATQELLAHKTERRKGTPRWVVALAVSVCLALLAWVFAAFTR